MGYIRVFDHSFRPPPFFLIIIEWVALALAAYLGVRLRFINSAVLDENLVNLGPKVMIFALVLSLCTLAMRVYDSGMREGYAGIVLRTTVAYALLGCAALTILYYLIPSMYLGRGVLAIAVSLAMVIMLALRFVYYRNIGAASVKRRVLILGSGARARHIEESLSSHRDSVEIVGYLQDPQGEPQLNAARLLVKDEPLIDIVTRLRVDELVVALDDRRVAGGGYFPADELLECKLSGVSVLDAINFYERETEKVELSMLRPSWMIFSDGFRFSAIRDIVKRGFDIFASLLLLLVTWPLMLLTALAIKFEDGVRSPVIYQQSRTGRLGKPFGLLKFRSMRIDAEQGGAQWAQENDDRITRVGRVTRELRLDELPQIYNVLRGDMSFVGPRPERPEFVEQFVHDIPFYDARHRVKPGLMGWAQLCYPYGASMEDAAQKLRYDLYYIKNHNLLFDLRILIQTIEVVLLGKGVR